MATEDVAESSVNNQDGQVVEDSVVEEVTSFVKKPVVISTSVAPRVAVTSSTRTTIPAIGYSGSMPNLASYSVVKPPVMIFRTGQQYHRVAPPPATAYHPYAPLPQIIRPAAATTHYIPNYVVPIRQHHPHIFAPPQPVYYAPCYVSNTSTQPTITTTNHNGLQIYQLETPQIQPITTIQTRQGNVTTNNNLVLPKSNLIKANSTSNLALHATSAVSYDEKIHRRAQSPKTMSVSGSPSLPRNQVVWSTGSLILQNQISPSPPIPPLTTTRNKGKDAKRSRAELCKDSTRRAYDRIWSRCKGEESCEILAARFQKLQVCDNNTPRPQGASHCFDIPVNSMLFEKAGTIPLPPREGVYIQGLTDSWSNEQ